MCCRGWKPRAGNDNSTRRGRVALAPDVVLAIGSAALAPLRQKTRTVPIVFAVVADPVGGGYVESLARPVATTSR